MLFNSGNIQTSVRWDGRSDFRIMYASMANQISVLNSYWFLSECFLKYLLCWNKKKKHNNNNNEREETNAPYYCITSNLFARMSAVTVAFFPKSTASTLLSSIALSQTRSSRVLPLTVRLWTADGTCALDGWSRQDSWHALWASLQRKGAAVVISLGKHLCELKWENRFAGQKTLHTLTSLDACRLRSSEFDLYHWVPLSLSNGKYQLPISFSLLGFQAAARHVSLHCKGK